VVESSRGAGFDDLDNDGDVDFVILNVNAAPSLGRTDSNTGNDRLSLRLIGTTGNRDAVGSTVWVTTVSGKKQVQATIAGRGYESHYGSRLYFGSGDDKMATIEVKWPSGRVETFARQGDSMVLIEGQSSP